MNRFLAILPRRWPYFVALACAISAGLNYLAGAETQTIVVGSALAGLACFATAALLGRHSARLTMRMSAETSVSWDVWMNEVRVGRLTDAQYAAMQRLALHDGHVAIAQVLNVGRVLLDVVSKVLVSIPLVSFWLVVLAVVASPETIVDLVQSLRAADAVAIQDGLRKAFLLAASLSASAVGFMWALGGHRFGFRNHYGAAVGRMIRRRLGVPTDGTIEVVRVDTSLPALVQG